MTIFLTYMSFLSSSSIACVFGLRYFALTYIYNDPEELFYPTFYVNMLLTVLLLFIASAFAYFFSRPFDKALRKMGAGYMPSNEEKVKCIRSIRNLNILTICANLLGFFIGQVYMVVDGLIKGRITNDPIRIFLIIAQAVAFGAMSAMFSINGVDKAMNKHRKYLHLHDINEQKYTRALSVATSITMTTLMCFFFIGINMMGTIYGAVSTGEPEIYTKNGFMCLIFSIIIATPPFIIVIRNLVDRIRSTKVSLDDIALKGDLSSRIDITTLDDFGDMTTSINMLIDKLSMMIRALGEKTEGVSRAADDITETTEFAQNALARMAYTMGQITGNSEEQNKLILQADKNIEALALSSESVKQKAVEQTDAVQNISASIAEMFANISSVADTAKKAQNVSEELSATSADGRSAIQNAIETMKEIQQAGDQVQLIIKSIQEITSQTNLLSMNAAIEAAHAGDFGVGFAVVADEVRSLASSSAQSTKDIQAHIKNMSDKISLGVETINMAGEAFNNISQKVEENAQFVNTIFAAMEEQRAGTQETQQSTIEVVDAVNTVNQLASEETKKALEIREFMQTVIKASKTTNDAIANSSDATTNLENTIAAVKENAANNKEAVETIQEQMKQFTV